MTDNDNKDAIARGAKGVQAAGDAVRQVGQKANKVGTDAAGHARDLANEARDTGVGLVDTVTEKVQSVAETERKALADQIDDVASAVHRSGTQLEGHQDWAAHLVERGAAELGVLAQTLRTNDLRGLMQGLQGLAQRQPALFTGASLAAGFALARVGRIAVADLSKDDLPSMPEVTVGQ